MAPLIVAVALAACPDAQTPARIADLHAQLDLESSHAKTWTLAWGGAWSALTLGQLALAPTFAPEDRVDLYVGAGSTALALALMLAMPLHVAQPPAVPRDGGCTELTALEAIADQARSDEAAGVTPLMHVLNVALNLAVGAVLALGFHHWESGAINAGAGILLGELMILSQPTGMIR